MERQGSAAAFVRDVAATTERHYGHAGPLLVEWLAHNGEEARVRLAGLWARWRQRSARHLPAGATAQAARIANRTGVFVIGAALAADVLDLPWKSRDKLGRVTPANEAVFRAGSAVLAAWLDEHGGTLVTGTETLLDQLRTFVTAHRARFETHKDGIGLLQGIDDTRPLLSAPRLGWVDLNENAQIKHVLLLDTAITEMGWDGSHVRQVMNHLKQQGLLHMPKSRRGFKTGHRGSSGHVQVFKIMGEVFEDPGDEREG